MSKKYCPHCKEPWDWDHAKWVSGTPEECKCVCHGDKYSRTGYVSKSCPHCTQKQEEDPLGEMIYGSYGKQEEWYPSPRLIKSMKKAKENRQKQEECKHTYAPAGDIDHCNKCGEPKQEEKSLNYNEEIAKISLEFVEMIINVSMSKKRSKTYWVPKFSEKIHSLLSKQKEEIRGKVKSMKAQHTNSDWHNKKAIQHARGYQDALINVLKLLEGKE